MFRNTDESDEHTRAGGVARDTTTDRRRVLAALGGSGAAFGAALAAGWHKPVVRTVVLPAHAQTSPPVIQCTVVDTDGPCDTTSTGAIEFRVFGTVSGDDVEGAALEIEYRNELQETGIEPGPFRTYTATATVQPDGSFDRTVSALPPTGEFWHEPEAEVTVRFQDQATFGPAECVDTHDCTLIGPFPP